MNLAFLDMGMAGVIEAGLIAMLAGLLAYLAVRGLLHRRLQWSDGHSLAWAWLVGIAVGAGGDTWQLFHMSVIPMQSPVTIRRVLDGIHDPDFLSTRVFAEFAAVTLGVALGWWLVQWRCARARGAADATQERE